MKPKARVLAVDDDPMNLSVVEEVLGEEYNVKTLNSGSRVLETAQKFRPDLVLLDIMMPDLSGYDVCRQLRAEPGLGHLKIVLVSAKAMLSERLEGYRAGADDYVTKPFDVDEFSAKVRVFVRLKSMEEIDELKSHFLGLLSHETRTPLTGILGPAEMLESDDTLDAESRRQMARLILSNATRLQKLFERVSMLSSLRSGDVEFNFESTDPGQVIRNVVAVVKEQFIDNEVDTNLDCPPAAEIVTDVSFFELALGALVENAICFSSKGGRVDIKLSEDQDNLSISVTDRGKGIAATFLPHVFDGFAVEDVDHHTGGDGLSLALCRAIVESLGGEVWGTSQPGVETRFVLRLPKSQSIAAAA